MTKYRQVGGEWIGFPDTMSDAAIDTATASNTFKRSIAPTPAVSAPTQTQGWQRYPEMALDQALSGASGVINLAPRALNYLTGSNVPLLPQETNSALVPQNTGESMFAAAARGFGGSAPLVALTRNPLLGVAGVTGGLANEAASELMPGNRWIGPAAGIVGGLLGGGAISALTRSASQGGAIPNFIESAGGGDPTLSGVGREIQTALAKTQVLSDTGLGDPSGLPTAMVSGLLSARPYTAANRLLNSPEALEVLSEEEPDLVRRLAAARLNINKEAFMGLPPDSRSFLIPNETERAGIESAIVPQGTGRGEQTLGALGGAFTGELVGSMVPAALRHFGVESPLGEAAMAHLGGVAGLLSSQLNLSPGHLVARAILDPVVRQYGMATGLGALGAETGVPPTQQ